VVRLVYRNVIQKEKNMFRVVVRYFTEIVVMIIWWILSLTIVPYMLFLSVFMTVLVAIEWFIDILEYKEKKQ